MGGAIVHSCSLIIGSHDIIISGVQNTDMSLNYVYDFLEDSPNYPENFYSTPKRSVAVITLGLCAAIVGGSISLNEAEVSLFSPKILIRLEALGLPESLIEIVHLGTELADVEQLIPDRFGDSIAEIQSKALAPKIMFASRSAMNT